MDPRASVRNMKRKSSTTSAGSYSKKQKYPKATYKRQNASLAPELKFNDTAFTTDATTTGAVIALSTVAAGDTALLRDGNKIQVKSFEIRARLELEAVTQNAVIRFMLVRDKNPNQAASPLATAGALLQTISPESLREIGFLSRFDVLMDKTVTMNTESGAVQKFMFKKYVKVRSDQVTCYGDGTASIPVTNSYNLLYLSDVAAGIVDVNVFGQCRMRFVG